MYKTIPVNVLSLSELEAALIIDIKDQVKKEAIITLSITIIYYYDYDIFKKNWDKLKIIQ